MAWNLLFWCRKGMSGVFGPDVRYREVSETMRYVYRAFPMIKCDLYHTPHQYCTFKQIKGASRHLMTVHDINFIHTKTGARLKRASLRFRQRMAHASHLAFISEFAKSDVERAFPFLQPYRIIYNGVKDYSVMEQHLVSRILQDNCRRMAFCFIFRRWSLIKMQSCLWK